MKLLDEWRANKRRWDQSVLLALPNQARVFEDGVGVKRTRSGLSWFIYYRAPKAAGSRQTKTVHEHLNSCANKTQAVATLVSRKATVHQGTYRRQERLQDVTFEQMCEIFVTAERHLSSIKSYAHNIKKHLMPWFGKNTPLRAITREQCESFYATKLDEKRAVASCNYYLLTLSLVCDLAVERKFLESNPAANVKTQKVNNRRERMLTDAEAGALVAAALKREDYLRTLFILLLGTGMRLGEALSMPWAFVNLELGMMRIVDSKNGEGRWVPLAADVLSELKRWRGLLPGEQFVFPGRKKGAHITEVKKGWASLCKAAGVKVGRHELRHNFVSQALAAGYGPADIMPITGHRSMKAFEGYAHTLAARKIALAESVIPSALRLRLPGDCQAESTGGPPPETKEQVG